MLWVTEGTEKLDFFVLMMQDALCLPVPLELHALHNLRVLLHSLGQILLMGAQMAVNEAIGHAVQPHSDGHTALEAHQPVQRQAEVPPLHLPEVQEVLS